MGRYLLMYHRGTLVEFNTWHDAAKTSYGIPEGGLIGFVDGVEAPDKQRTLAYSDAEPHPTNSDDYIWLYGDYIDGSKDDLDEDAVIALGWFVVAGE